MVGLQKNTLKCLQMFQLEEAAAEATAKKVGCVLCFYLCDGC
jgi:hypothetical protein